MRFSAYLALSLLSLLPLAAQADDSSNSPALTDQVSEYLKGQSILLGVSYDQGVFKMNGVNPAAGTAQLTDNGHANAIIDYTSPENVLTKMHMKYGDAVWGFNFVGSFGQQDTNFQNNLGQSVLVGQNLGTKVTGDYLGGAPFIYLRLSPLYPGGDSYWLFGYGVGAAVWHFSGNPIVYQPNPLGGTTAVNFNFAGSTKVSLYQTWRWQFHYGNWDALVTVKTIGPRQVNGYNVSYSDYGFGIAYNLHF